MDLVAHCNLVEYYQLAADSPDNRSILRGFFGCLANALNYLHSQQVRHHNIKPENILIKADRVLLTDFSISLNWEHLLRSMTVVDSGKTWQYAAPEVVRHEPRNSASDVYSLGCVFIEMVTVIKGNTILGMCTFFSKKTANYRFYSNLKHMPEWVRGLATAESEGDNVALIWATSMVIEDASVRPTASALFASILNDSKHIGMVFCGPCCKDGEVSTEGESDGDLWIED
jgi:serine/threonine protein kinase